MKKSIPLLTVELALKSLERAYIGQARGTAVNGPRSDLYLPGIREGSAYAFKTMEGGLTESKIVALRLNSDTIRWQERENRVVKDKLPTAPGKKWVGLIQLFRGNWRAAGDVPGWCDSKDARSGDERAGGARDGAPRRGGHGDLRFRVAGRCSRAGILRRPQPQENQRLQPHPSKPRKICQGNGKACRGFRWSP